MEVHKHPHHVTHKKKLGEYLLEFLMLFLAVFLGFLAENRREEIAERHKEKEYMETFVNDLERDTLLIHYVNGLLKDRNIYLDTLLTRVNTPGILNTPNKLYEVIHKAIGASYFTFTERTLSQLKSAGGMRLIRNREVSDSIADYDYEIYWHSLFLKQRFETSEKLHALEHQIFIKNEYKNLTPEQIKNLDHQLKIQNLSAEKITEFANIAAVLREQNDTYQKKYLDIIERKATNLRNLIKKEYHLK
ncbi:MAG: hypothetical protein M3004_05515 [Bacteroidota bacterium]|nr:hypothetical protein [Bacteroidota bacterium]